MKTFKQYITELFDKGYNWNIKSEDKLGNLKAYFTTENSEYEVNIVGDGEFFNISFGARDKGSGDNFSIFKITNENRALKVLTTITEILNYCIDKYNPNEIAFTAEKSEIGRADMYEKMLVKLLPDNYEVEVLNAGSEKAFNIKKKEQ